MPNTIHTVQPGETIRQIAERYGVLVNDIIKANNLGLNYTPEELSNRRTLVIPISDTSAPIDVEIELIPIQSELVTEAVPYLWLMQTPEDLMNKKTQDDLRSRLLQIWDTAQYSSDSYLIEDGDFPQSVNQFFNQAHPDDFLNQLTDDELIQLYHGTYTSYMEVIGAISVDSEPFDTLEGIAEAYAYLKQLQSGASLPFSAPFDPDQATTDWLEATYNSARFPLKYAYTGDTEQLDPAALDTAYRESILADAFIVATYAGLNPDGITLEEFLQINASKSTIEIAELGAAVAQLAVEKAAEIGGPSFGLDYVFEAQLKELGLTNIMNVGVGYGNITDLADLSVGYLTAVGWDEVRREVYEWQPEREQALLGNLQAEINRMPAGAVLGLSAAHVRAAFQRYHDGMAQRQSDLAEYRPMLAEYEQARADELKKQATRDASFHLPDWMEFAAGFIDIADLAVVIRDFLTFGELPPEALLSFLPFIPHSAVSGMARLVSRIPGAGLVGRGARNAADLVRGAFRRIGDVDGALLDGERAIEHTFSASKYDGLVERPISPPPYQLGQARSVRMIKDAAQRLGVNWRDYANEIWYTGGGNANRHRSAIAASGLPEQAVASFYTPASERRILLIQPINVIDDVEGSIAQLHTGVHELIHAIDYNEILKSVGGNWEEAQRLWYRIGEGIQANMYNAYKEITTEIRATRIIEGSFPSLPPALVADSRLELIGNANQFITGLRSYLSLGSDVEVNTGEIINLIKDYAVDQVVERAVGLSPQFYEDVLRRLREIYKLNG